MSAMMDMYLNSADSSISLQDMCDVDLKSEIESLVGGQNDFSGFNFDYSQDLDGLPDMRWLSSNSNNSNSSLNFDLNCDDHPAMVNPTVVLPALTLHNTRSPSPALKESHLKFSPSIFKIDGVKAESNQVKKDLFKKLNDDVDEVIEEPVHVVKTIPKITSISSRTNFKSTVTRTPTLITFKNTINKPVSTISVATNVGNFNTIRTVASNTANKIKVNRFGSEIQEKIYPKPAYSYSCLIAMALKNSRSGSLPVSEIYNFMCKHFPYFITAPSGWKNSVRHNLSLNKCFEKIEKPALNGAQRKGCLWAMNPAKISKMDEEVQKWSRKDPTTIRKAMSNPENLESLERGELKFSCSYDEGDECSAESEEGSDYEQEMESQVKFVNVTSLNTDNEEGSDVDIEVHSDFDVEASDSTFEEVEEEQEMLRVEMELAHKELFEYEKTGNNKRRRMILAEN